MSILAFLFALEAGFSSTSELLYNSPDWDNASLQSGYQIDSPYVQLEAAGELFGFFQAGGSAQIFIADIEGWQYAPYDARFVFFFRAIYKGFTAGFEHLCIHPICSASRPDLPFLYGGGNRIYLRYEAKVPVGKRSGGER